MAFPVGLHIFGAGFGSGLENRFGITDRRGKEEFANPLELDRDGVGLAKRAAILGEDRADFRRRAITVIRQGLDHHRDTAGPVAFVADLFVVDVAALTGGPLDGSLNVVLRHVGRTRCLNGRAQTRICIGIGSACTSRDDDLAPELGKLLSALLILRALPVHDVLELAVTCHGLYRSCKATCCNGRRKPPAIPACCPNPGILADQLMKMAKLQCFLAAVPAPRKALAQDSPQAGSCACRRPPSRSGSTRSARPVLSSVSTKTPQRVPGPWATVRRSVGSLRVKR